MRGVDGGRQRLQERSDEGAGTRAVQKSQEQRAPIRAMLEQKIKEAE